MKFEILENEHWWGGTISQSEKMPFDNGTETVVCLQEKRSTVQSAPFFLSDKGRYIWSEKGFTATFEKGLITCEGEAEILLNADGTTLREAFVHAKKSCFPYEKEVHTPREFYEIPQYVEKTMQNMKEKQNYTLSELIEYDKNAREEALRLIDKK